MNPVRLVCAIFVLAAAPAFAQISVSLASNLASPQPVGTPIVFTASASGGSGNYDFQFSANLASSQQQIKQDVIRRPTRWWRFSALPPARWARRCASFF